MDTTTDPVDSWLQLLRGFSGSAGGMGKLQWSPMLDDTMHRLSVRLGKTPQWQAALASHVSGLANDGKRTAAALRQLTNTLLADPLPATSGTEKAGQTEPMAAMFALLPIWPALGLAAGRQEDWQAMQRALPDLLTASEQYGERILGMMLDALERWYAELCEGDDRGPPDAERLKTSWLDALDTCWQEMLADPEHTERLRRLNGALDAFRRSGEDIARQYLKALGVATREDLAGTQLRMHQLRRRLPAADVGEELQKLRAEVNTLRQEVNDLRKSGQRNHDGDPS